MFHLSHDAAHVTFRNSSNTEYHKASVPDISIKKLRSADRGHGGFLTQSIRSSIVVEINILISEVRCGVAMLSLSHRQDLALGGIECSIRDAENDKL